MATRSNVAHELTDVDKRILELLGDGDRNPSFLAERVGETRQYVHQRLQLLVAADHVENIGHGLYSRALEPIPDGGQVPDDETLFPLECVCGQMVMSPGDAHDHLYECDEIG